MRNDKMSKELKIQVQLQTYQVEVVTRFLQIGSENGRNKRVSDLAPPIPLAFSTAGMMPSGTAHAPAEASIT